ncbi:Mannitol dehydrogenase domain protein [Xylanimonas cellulosilytica DSM 15894]|uniref:Mannitol dehydrogenase domain protein n=1 Tax=Xylanimonas cellulosilytica (strain DSM 15894 / JCM 12276 / CECT 5975 / KCTC 9989 / LMG 20990 / NBRC 107835 / XIL07) TaxID=446471 RepID=D1BXN9_XYLCX|nr:mannitol dehydrogenase family protein [Xylanimonas cellulosilytica]ACZ31680.1 Mannitol dehydrogenase domain protein [Xylanimonas cellulosilytica DSM 15894]
MTTTSLRLGAGTPLPDGVLAPPVVPTGVGIVHLGWGAFHRAHQALYTQEAMAASGDLSWGILGDVERTPQLVPALREQDGRYTVLSVGLEGGELVEQATVVASVLDVAYPGDETPRLLAAMAAPTTHLITLTVTEKGYCRTGDGHLDLGQAQPDVDAFVAELGGAGEQVPAATAMGLLVRGLAARFLGEGTPVTVLSCDNMAHNGKVLKRIVDEFIAAAGPAADAFSAWLAASTTWPSSMVDRITPAVTPATLDRVEEILGARDEAAISGEPFRQWVIEDSFAAPRPQWELVGADLTDDVAPWEEAKLRMLNGTHSLIAYSGRLFGYATMAEAVVAPEIADHARAYMFEDALPSVTPPAGADLPAYGEGLLERFANPATGHSTRQVSTDGTQKIPFRWGGALQFALSNGRVPQGIAFGLAAWSEFVRRAVRDGVDLGDPAGTEALTAVVTEHGNDVEGVARGLLALPGVLPGGAGNHPELADAVVAHAQALAAASSGLL